MRWARVNRGTMSPTQFITGVTSVLVFWVAFYAWLLHSVLHLRKEWTAIAAVGLSLAFSISAVYGYRIWLSERSSKAHDDLEERPRPIRLVLPSIALAILVWSAIHLFAAGNLVGASLVSAASGAGALYILLRVLGTASTTTAVSHTTDFWAFQRHIGAFIIAFNALLFLLGAATFVIQGLPELALIPLAFFLLLAFWARRKFRA